MLRFAITLPIAIMGLSGVSNAQARGPGVTGEKGNIRYFKSEDPGMNAAIKKARKTSGVFLKAFLHPHPGLHDFALKKPYPIGDSRTNEHLWISQLTFKGDHFEGTVANEPSATTAVKLGDRVSVRLEEISDWKYVDGKKLVGGYTIRYGLSKMSEAERKAILDQLDFVLE